MGARKVEVRDTVHNVMSREVVTVGPGTSLQAVGDLLLLHDISGVPVVDNEGTLLGLVSKTDLLRAGDVPPREATAAEWMSPMVRVIEKDASLSEAARRMSKAGIHRLPVVSEVGKLVGIVTSSDLMRWLARQD